MLVKTQRENEMKQNDLERIKDQLERGLISVDEANVQMVKCERFRIIKGKLPQSVRKSLNSAVKSGVLGHMKKDGYKPECYYFEPFKHMADAKRTEIHNEMIDFKTSNVITR